MSSLPINPSPPQNPSSQPTKNLPFRPKHPKPNHTLTETLKPKRQDEQARQCPNTPTKQTEQEEQDQPERDDGEGEGEGKGGYVEEFPDPDPVTTQPNPNSNPNPKQEHQDDVQEQHEYITFPPFSSWPAAPKHRQGNRNGEGKRTVIVKEKV